VSLRSYGKVVITMKIIRFHYYGFEYDLTNYLGYATVTFIVVGADSGTGFSRLSHTKISTL
jgi:hypothetical protein